MSNDYSNSVMLSGCCITIWCILAWFTHVIVCLKAASWGFLIAGALVFPVAVIHGTGVWFGAW